MRRTKIWRRLVVLVATVAGATALASGSVAQAGLLSPAPSDDPFYAVPSGLDGVANGTVLASRQVTTAVLGVRASSVPRWTETFSAPALLCRSSRSGRG
ncbi:hypothetical protein [Amycolatopsis lurida]|uniref:Uncharacterized protein n=1 Tax=Amycolatopsis lurida NRRL 2430 TaxID=1460371 RepID=A0A2P2FJK0_AMYLU|nr:hypothetical protein [Amycolatopsis lurida]KFU76907.1 hypothetical protein BB31_33770 [Amycolatopsis lurida NRRL 2430]